MSGASAARAAPRVPMTYQDVLAGRDAPGGWTRKRLAEWGVPWPPPAFWKEHLVRHGAPYLVVDDGSDDVQESPFMSESTRKNIARQRAILKGETQ